MCGIYGTTIPYSKNQVLEKLKRTAFRGPDQMGIAIYENGQNQVILGHNRLSIIDLDPRSNQPLTYLDSIHIVFNGEIFNFESIKNKLISKGHSFKTSSDTEVITAAYKEYGDDCVDHFNGMFAFVIYDTKNNRLFGARDRLGQKPFYYYHKENYFEFASQVSSIQLYNKQLTISKKSIDKYLFWGNIPDPDSIFNEIKKLKAGHSFSFDLDTGKFSTKQYWDIDYLGVNNFSGSFQDAKVKLDSILHDAVKIRLFADVPVGVFLSGGVDSSAIAAIASQTSSTQVKTFSVRFNEKGFDESIYAQKVSDHLNTDHTVIDCDYNEGIDLINNFCHYYDEPFADSSAIPSMLLSKHTKNKVTVALSGDAGDENFIGYHRYQWIKRGQKILKIPVELRKLGAYALNLMPHYKLKIIADAIMHKSPEEAYLLSMTDNSNLLLNRNDDYWNFEEKKYLLHNKKNLIERVSDFDLKTYLNWDINTKVDRASMAYSLEVRSPLLDHRIVEFGRSLPTEYKFKNGVTKRILKEVLYDYVPKKLFDRPKAGFTMPFREWFKHELKDYVMDELSDSELDVIPGLNKKFVQQGIKEHMDGSWNRYPMIWKLLVLKQWMKVNGQGISVR